MYAAKILKNMYDRPLEDMPHLDLEGLDCIPVLPLFSSASSVKSCHLLQILDLLFHKTMDSLG